MDPSLVPIFNQAQMDIGNILHGLDSVTPDPVWLGELSGESGEPLAASVLVGPITGPSPMVEKTWDSLQVKGEGRAMVILWIDNRKVATGMLNMAGGPGEPDRLKIPQGVHTGYSLLALIIFTGRMLGCTAFYEPV